MKKIDPRRVQRLREALENVTDITIYEDIEQWASRGQPESHCVQLCFMRVVSAGNSATTQSTPTGAKSA